MRPVLLAGGSLLVILITSGCMRSTETPLITHGEQPIQNSSGVGESNSGDQHTTGKYQVALIATGLTVPRSIIFPEENTLYVAERGGKIWKIGGGEKILYTTIPEVRAVEEAGLMGMALDPDFATNKFIYISFATDAHVRIDRYRDTATTLVFENTIIDMLPVAKYHAGGGLKFGPDGLLYMSVGDATEKQKAQDLDTFHGKILRLQSDGTLPVDNPFSGSALRSYGHRNIQGFDRDMSGAFYASEHGPSGFDGPAGGDEINAIIPGGNYGWPLVSHEKHRDGMIDPLVVYTPAVAPASLLIYHGNMFPEWKDKIFVGALKGERLIRIDPKTKEQEDFFHGTYGRIRAVAEAPDGSLYFSTSNNDGRGTYQSDGDKIYRILR